MIAVIEFKNRKTGETFTREICCVGYHDARKIVKAWRKLSKAKIRLKSLRSG